MKHSMLLNTSRQVFYTPEHYGDLAAEQNTTAQTEQPGLRGSGCTFQLPQGVQTGPQVTIQLFLPGTAFPGGWKWLCLKTSESSWPVTNYCFTTNRTGVPGGAAGLTPTQDSTPTPRNDLTDGDKHNTPLKTPVRAKLQEIKLSSRAALGTHSSFPSCCHRGTWGALRGAGGLCCAPAGTDTRTQQCQQSPALPTLTATAGSRGHRTQGATHSQTPRLDSTHCSIWQNIYS